MQGWVTTFGFILVSSPISIINVLQEFIECKHEAKDLEDWANLIEGREDIKYDESYSYIIDNVIYSLANPVLEGEITKKSCGEFILQLNNHA